MKKSCLNCKFLPEGENWCKWETKFPSWVNSDSLDIPDSNTKAGYVEAEADSHRNRPYLECGAWQRIKSNEKK